MSTVDRLNQAYYEEPETKAPPMLATGPLAWMRENLFSSLTDTVLTVIGIVLIVSLVTSFVQWTVASANWFTVIFNMRLFVVGSVETFMESRILLLVLFIAVIVGVNLATWTHVSLRVWIVLAVVAALLFIVPAIIIATIPEPPVYVAAGQNPIVFGSVNETPIPQIGFVAKEGETITVRLAEDYSTTDTALASLAGFAGRAVDALRNGAQNRLETQALIPELQDELAGDSLTPHQRDAVQAELDKLEVPPVVTETYAVNQAPVQVRILDGNTLEPLAEATLSSQSDVLDLQAPAAGWYVLDQSIPSSDTSDAVLAITGTAPLIERNFLITETDAEGTITSERIFEYRRLSDNWTFRGKKPRVEGKDLPFLSIITHQFRGERTLPEYLILMLSQFFDQLNRLFALVLAFAVIGYYGARFIDRRFSPQLRPRQVSRRTATWLWIVLPVVAFVLIAGIAPSGLLEFSDPQFWGGVLLTMLLTVVGIVGSFPIGVALALGRRSNLPVVSFFSTLYIEVVRGVPLITVLFMSMLMVPFVIPSLGGPDSAPYRAMVAVTLFSAAYLAENVRGGLQSLPPGQEEAAKALGLSGWQVTIYITLPQALRAVIPALVGQFISLYKDTSLVAIVGLIDLTNIAYKVIPAQTEFQGMRRENFVFISIIYFAFSYVMSIVSRRLEASGSGAARRV